MIRLCMRPGCDRDAAARLTYDPIACEVWLDDLAERVGRSQEICSLHAQRLTVPRGWRLSDRRSDQPAMFIPPDPPVETAPVAAVEPGPRRRRRRGPAAHPATQTMELFEVLRQELAQAEAGEPGPEVAVAPAAEPPTVDSEPSPVESEPATVDGEVPEALRATSPLLARAFASTGHQRSVLTQRSAEHAADDAADEGS